MKMLCIIGLAVVLAFIFLAAVPVIFSTIVNTEDDFGLISSIIIIIAIISTISVNFYFTPEFFGYQKVVSENYVDNEE